MLRISRIIGSRTVVASWLVVFLACTTFQRGALEGGLVPCQVESFGGVDQDPLLITGDDIALPDDCVLDFGDRSVEISGVLRGNRLSILAGELNVGLRGVVEGGGGWVVLRGIQGARHPGSIAVAGPVTCDGLQGGEVILEADGAVSLDSRAELRAAATSPGGNGGFVTLLAGGAVSLSAGSSLRAVAGSEAFLGGDILISSGAGSLEALGSILATGGLGSGGRVALESAGGVGIDGSIRAAGVCEAPACTLAGEVRVSSAEGDLKVSGEIDVTAARGDSRPAGTVTLECARDLTILGQILLESSGAAVAGNFLGLSGGSIVLGSAASVSASGRDTASSGGSVELHAGASVSLEGELAADGGEDADAGAIAVSAGLDLVAGWAVHAAGNYPTGGIDLASLSGDLTVLPGATLDASGLGVFGTGGPITLRAVDLLEVNGSVLSRGAGGSGLGGAIGLDTFGLLQLRGGALLDASGDVTDALGEGGLVDVQACQLELAAGSVAVASGLPGGLLGFAGGTALSMHGKVSGAVLSIRHGVGVTPDLAGAELEPPSQAIEASNLYTTCAGPSPPGTPFTRSDCNVSGATDISDAIYVLGYLFQGSPSEVSCEKACDMNDDGGLDISDAISVLGFLFGGSSAPPAPFPGCGQESSSDNLTCRQFGLCP